MDPAPHPSAPSRPRGPVVPEQARGIRLWAARAIWLVVRGLVATIRWDFRDPHESLALAGRGPVIFAIWHNQIALSLWVHRRYVARQNPGRRLAGLVSASRDGGLLARVMELSGVVPIRGSSSRRGPQALRELVRAGSEGLDLALTPDGPRGPRHVVQPGVIAAAHLTGFPIIPAAVDVRPRWTLRSWDRFEVPLPFSRCRVTFGRPMELTRDGGPDREVLRAELEHRLHELAGADASAPVS